jgi:hypothetical protein
MVARARFPGMCCSRAIPGLLLAFALSSTAFAQQNSFSRHLVLPDLGGTINVVPLPNANTFLTNNAAATLEISRVPRTSTAV